MALEFTPTKTDKILIFLSNIIHETWINGKLFITWVANEVPGLTSYPGLMTTFNTALHDQTKKAYIDLVVQLIAAFGAAHRGTKLIVNSLQKTKTEINTENKL